MTAILKSVFKRLECGSLLEYLKSMPKETILNLYRHPAPCAAVFRELPEISRLFILRVVCLGGPLQLSVVTSWINDDHESKRDEVIRALEEMHVIEDPTHFSPAMFKLQDDFKANFRIAIARGQEHWAGSDMVLNDPHPRDVHLLDKYARERWECILHYMAQSEDKEPVSSKNIVASLLRGGFITMENQKPLITALGFQFLLLDVSKQVWILVLNCLEIIKENGMDFNECLVFLFRLNFLTLGKDYSSEKFSGNLLNFLQMLREFGLVYQKSRKSQRFYPTRLASNICTRNCSEIKLESSSDGGIIVDSDYSLRAYTSSGLVSNLLEIFTTLVFKTEGVTVCKINRQSSMNAFSKGITADQIVSFLKAHAHKVTMNNGQCLPQVVADQLHLWEGEINRIKYAQCVFYSNFNSVYEFERIRDFAKSMNAIIWENPPEKMVAVSRDKHKEIKKFYNNLKMERNF